MEPPKSQPFGRLIAWDPVKQQQVWKQDYVSPWNGGTLTTAGNLVFQGSADGRFIGYNATSGEKLWESPTGTGIVAGPATYTIDGVNMLGCGRGVVSLGRLVGRPTWKGREPAAPSPGGRRRHQTHQYQMAGLLEGVKYDPAHIEAGTLLYVSNCVFCHGVPGVDKGGNINNLGYVSTETIANLKDFVFNGPFRDQGMPDFTGKLKEEDVVKIQAFIQGTRTR